MPLSEKHKIVFVHIPKTGGTSLETLLEIPCVPHALLVRDLRRLPALQHYTPLQLLPLLNKEQLESWTKIVVIRNPYERVVSDYCWFQQRHAHVLSAVGVESFAEFVRWRKSIDDKQCYADHPLFSHFRPMRDYFQEDVFQYDLVIRLEDMAAGIDALRKLVPTLGEQEILRENTSEHGDYRAYYDSETRQLIEELEQPSNFNYRF